MSPTAPDRPGSGAFLWADDDGEDDWQRCLAMARNPWRNTVLCMLLRRRLGLRKSCWLLQIGALSAGRAEVRKLTLQGAHRIVIVKAPDCGG